MGAAEWGLLEAVPRERPTGVRVPQAPVQEPEHLTARIAAGSELEHHRHAVLRGRLREATVDTRWQTGGGVRLGLALCGEAGRAA